MLKRILGVDVGISSIGWALVELSGEDSTKPEKGRIIASGVRVFTQAENPKDGESLAKPRRDARLARRRNHRRTHRLAQIKNMFYQYGLIKGIPRAKVNQIYVVKGDTKDPWTLRKEALHRKLTEEEFSRALTHIAKRRGFKSLRKSEASGSDTKAKETQKMLSALQETRNQLLAGKYQTVGEMFATAPEYAEAKRNKTDSYKNSIPRELLEDEARTIFTKQRNIFKSEFASQKFEEEYFRMAFTQNPIQSMEHMVGYCTFEKDQKRAPRQSYSAELFTALGKINNIILKPREADADERSLTQDEREKTLALCHENAKVTFKQMRNEINLSDNWLFNLVDYNFRKKKADGKEKDPESETFFEMKGYHEIRKAVSKNCGDNAWEKIKADKNILNAIAQALSTEKDDDDITKKLKGACINEKTINAVLELNFRRFIHLSFKALDKINPFLTEGFKYTDACIQAGYDPLKPNQNEKKDIYLPKLTQEQEEQITNPVVKRAVTQFRKVLNAIIRHPQYGKFDQMNIELARDLSNSFEKRMEIKAGQKDFQAEKERARKKCLEEHNINPDISDNLLKFRLWEQQDGRCPYSYEYIKPEKIAEQGYTDIDHIIPYSRSLDDSLANRVLCLASENRQKKNLIPFEYFGKDGEKWNTFVGRINAIKSLPKPKKNRLLKRKFDDKDMEGFKERNINDTRYISRFVKNWVENNLEFAGDKEKRQKVFVRSGSLTAFLRHQWGLTKKRSENDKHHALDAIVTACSTQGMVKFVSDVAQKIEGYDWLNKMRPRFAPPWQTFRDDVQSSLDTIFVSRAPRHKVTGAAHKETISSKKYLKEGYSTVKTPLIDMKLKNLENMFNKTNCQKLYETLRVRLEQFNDDPQKAFGDPQNPVRMPTNSGKPGPIIRSVKIMTPTKSGLPVRKGIADNGEMVRIDVFEKKGKFYLVPIYVADFTKKELPNHAIAANTLEVNWPVIDSAYNFKFSLFKDDLIQINSTGKPEDSKMGYFTGCHRGTGAINIDLPDRTASFKSIGARNLKLFKKFQVDLLGNYFEITNEKRVGVIRKNVMANNTGFKAVPAVGKK